MLFPHLIKVTARPPKGRYAGLQAAHALRYGFVTTENLSFAIMCPLAGMPAIFGDRYRRDFIHAGSRSEQPTICRLFPVQKFDGNSCHRIIAMENSSAATEKFSFTWSSEIVSVEQHVNKTVSAASGGIRPALSQRQLLPLRFDVTETVSVAISIDRPSCDGNCCHCIPADIKLAGNPRREARFLYAY